MVNVSFYESGKGETIIIEFPDGGLGIIDAHPSKSGSRKTISDLVEGRNIHFICLTHPHSDHGLDILNAMKSAGSVKEFWHSVDDIHALVFSYTQQNVFPGLHNELLTELRKEWGKFLLDLYDEVLARTSDDPGFLRLIDSGQSELSFTDATLHFLAPTREERNMYFSHIHERLKGKNVNKPNENYLSVVLSLEYAGHSLIFGGDALRRNWQNIIENKDNKDIPLPSVIKAPHHGARNAWSPMKNRSYVKEFTKRENRPFPVLFAGDTQHPHPEVFQDLKSNTNLICLANGMRSKRSGTDNPLGIEIEGAASYDESMTCNPEISFKISENGKFEKISGRQCAFCSCEKP